MCFVCERETEPKIHISKELDFWTQIFPQNVLPTPWKIVSTRSPTKKKLHYLIFRKPMSFNIFSTWTPGYWHMSLLTFNKPMCSAGTDSEYCSLLSPPQLNSTICPHRHVTIHPSTTIKYKQNDLSSSPTPLPTPGVRRTRVTDLCSAVKLHAGWVRVPWLDKVCTSCLVHSTSPGIKLVHNHLIGLKACYRYHTKANPSVNAGACKLPFRCRQKKDEKKKKPTTTTVCPLSGGSKQQRQQN